MSNTITESQDDYIERNIKTFTEKAIRGKEFSTSYVQRVCRIGYNQARYTIDEMLDRKIISPAENCEWGYILNI